MATTKAEKSDRDPVLVDFALQGGGAHGAFTWGALDRLLEEPWLQIDKAEIKGDPQLAAELLETSYDEGIEPSFAYELEFDHGTMVPLHFLSPGMDRPVVPIFFNTLAVPQPTARRCLAFGRVIGKVAARSAQRIGLIATGGLSHDPGERNHGVIDSDFDHQFMSAMATGNTDRLGRYSRSELAAAGAKDGALLLYLRHTSASLVIQENADPSVLDDLMTALDRLAPEDAGWTHDTEGPDDMPAHVKTMLTAASLHIPVLKGELALGTWQAIYLIEHRTRPHRREVMLQFIGASA